jgi:hypothetical protein
VSADWTRLDPEACPVCGLPGGHPALDGAKALHRCARCGDHWVDEAMWRHLKAGLPVQTRRRLTAALRGAADQGKAEVLLGAAPPTARVEKIIAPIQPLDTVAQRMDAFVLWLGDHHPSLGETADFRQKSAVDAALQTIEPEWSAVIAAAVREVGWCTGAPMQAQGLTIGATTVALTPAGWARYEQLRTTSTGSTRVFIAMSNHYGNGLQEAEHAAQADALLAAIRGALPAPLFGYRVEKDAAVDQITDAIIAGIRRAPFVIADLTAERPNVYFEAGMALGLGKPVVFCRRKGETAHFDVQAYKLIEWEPDKLADFRARLDAHLQARGLTPARDPS